MHILEGLDHVRRHQVVKHLVVLVAVDDAFCEELVSGALVEIVMEPRKPESTQTVAEQIQERLNVIVGVHYVRVEEFSVRGEHGVPFKLFVLFAMWRVDPVGIAEVDQVIVSILNADIVQFDILVHKTDCV